MADRPQRAGHPWGNTYSESFNSRPRDELLNANLFRGEKEKAVLLVEGRGVYSELRLRSVRSTASSGGLDGGPASLNDWENRNSHATWTKLGGRLNDTGEDAGEYDPVAAVQDGGRG